MDTKKPGVTTSHLMRRFVFVMGNIDQDNRPWAAAIIISTWLTLSLFHDACAIQSESMIDTLIGSQRNLMVPLIMALVEVTLCASFITVASGNSGGYLESVVLAMCAQLFGTFLTYMWAMEDEPEFGVLGSLTDPVLCVLLLFACRRVCTNSSRVLSLLLISIGLVFLSLNLDTILKTDKRFIIRMCCGLFYILRNIIVAYWHEESVPVGKRDSKGLIAIGVALVLAVAGFMIFLPLQWVLPVVFALLTCCIHVCLTYITCAVLLAKFSIPTLCLLTTLVKVAECQVLMTSSHRPGLLFAAVSCTVVVTGVYLYVLDTVETGHTFHSLKAVSTNEMLTRIQFLLFFACILGMLFYVFTPRVSSRDLDNLSLVGLDKVIRRLLSVKQAEGHEH